ncbi:MAG TPA: transcriptional repressor [Prosthecobacter sp.]|nr:transcriptional repressor [Prosthecobacter sp.]
MTSRQTDSSDAASALVKDILDYLLYKGVRQTPALVALLNALAENRLPMPIAQLKNQDSLRSFDLVTIYRLINRLESTRVVRSIAHLGKAKYYQIVVPGRHSECLVCNSCGKLEEIDVTVSLETVKSDITTRSGWQRITPALELLGLCPACSKTAAGGRLSS